MNAERILLAAECIGDGRWFIEKAVSYASERVVFDRPIGANQGVQFPIAHAYAAIQAADLVYRAASLFEEGEPCGEQANMANSSRPRRPGRRRTSASTRTEASGLRSATSVIPRDAPLLRGPSLEQPRSRVPRPARAPRLASFVLTSRPLGRVEAGARGSPEPGQAATYLCDLHGASAVRAGPSSQKAENPDYAASIITSGCGSTQKHSAVAESTFVQQFELDADITRQSLLSGSDDDRHDEHVVLVDQPGPDRLGGEQDRRWRDRDPTAISAARRPPGQVVLDPRLRPRRLECPGVDDLVRGLPDLRELLHEGRLFVDGRRIVPVRQHLIHPPSGIEACRPAARGR